MKVPVYAAKVSSESWVIFLLSYCWYTLVNFENYTCNLWIYSLKYRYSRIEHNNIILYYT